MNLEDKIAQLRALHQYKDKTEEELRKIAQKKLEDEQYKVEWVGLLSKEKTVANKLFRQYRKKYQIENISDIDNLKLLVQNQIFLHRIQNKMLSLAKTEALPDRDTVDALHKTQQEILTLKQKLGLFDKEEKTEWEVFWKKLLRKIDKYINIGENKIVVHLKCPYCYRMYLARRNIKDFELLPHPFFNERNIIYSNALFDLLDKERLTANEVAKVLNTTAQFIDRLYKEVYLQEKNVTRETE